MRWNPTFVAICCFFRESFFNTFAFFRKFTFPRRMDECDDLTLRLLCLFAFDTRITFGFGAVDGLFRSLLGKCGNKGGCGM